MIILPMDNNAKVRVAITQGDTNGVGYELIFKAFSEPEMLELCTPIIYGSPKVAAYYGDVLDVEASFTIISDAREAREGVVNLLTAFEEEVKVEPGVATETSGETALKALDRALADYRDGLFDVLVTNPIDNTAEFHFSGQSRYIEDHMEAEGHGLTLLVDEGLRIALATRNLPLRQVVECVSQSGIEQNCRALWQSLRRDFRISNPRIAVLSINPKAGDNGLLGTEEQEIIRPALDALTESGVQAFGPYAADALFAAGDYTCFDAVLAMYYDQGLTPFRALSQNGGVNYTIGLPLVRTAPELRNSISLGGKGVADPLPLRHAIYLAIDIFRNRTDYDEAGAHPLPKLYKEKKDESEKVRFAIPKKRDPKAPSANKGNEIG